MKISPAPTVIIFSVAAFLSAFTSAGAMAEECSVGSPGSPALHQENLFLGDANGNAYALEWETRKILWETKVEGPVIFRPSVAGELALFPLFSGGIAALDVKTGETRWTFETGAFGDDYRDRYINGVLTLWNGLVIFTSEDFNIYALDAETGDIVWRRTLPEEPQAREVPVIDGVAYVGAWDGYLYAINAHDGSLRWRSQTTSDHIGRTIRNEDGQLAWISDKEDGETLSNQAPYATVRPIILEDAIIFGDWSGNLMAVDRKTGVERWRFKADTKNVRGAGPSDYLMHYEGAVYFTTAKDRTLYAVNAKTGEKIWRRVQDYPVYGPMPVRDSIGAIYLEPGEGNPRGKAELWDFSVPERLETFEAVSAPPLLVDGRTLVTPRLGGKLIVYDLESRKQTTAFCVK